MAAASTDRAVDHEVVVAGGGPTGTMLAAELALAGVDVLVVERRVDHDLAGSRAGGLHARTLEVLDQRGIVDRFLAEGRATPFQLFGGILLDIADLPTRYGHGLALWQRHIERILAGWADELGVPVRRGQDVTGFAQDDEGVDVALADGTTLRCRYLVGCDGGRSAVRRAAGIEFAGWDATISWLNVEADADHEPELGVRPESGAIAALDEGGYRFVLTEPTVDHTGPPTLDDLRAALISRFGTDFGVHEPTSISRFTDAARQAVAYRRGRVLLAGDAAHVHAPQGGQGLNTGVQDAVNLGWKLALVAHGSAPEALLDTYHAERHPVGAAVLQHTLAQVALQRTDPGTAAVKAALADLLAMDQPRRHLGAVVSGLAIAYDLGDGHPLLGHRMPDLDLDAPGGPQRTYALLHQARPVLLHLGADARFDLSPWADRVREEVATATGPWELPDVGAVPAPDAVLIRPDGYVAWAGTPTDPALPDALTAWFGPARPG